MARTNSMEGARTSTSHALIEALQVRLAEVSRESSRLAALLEVLGSAEAISVMNGIVINAAAMTQRLAEFSPPQGEVPAPRRNRLHGGYVLLVEEGLLQGEGLAARLREEGFEIMIATRPADALSQAATRRPAAIVVDLDLRGAEGPDLVWRLHNQLGDVPMVLLTTQGIDHPAVATAIELFGSTYLEKPCDPALLVATIERSLPIRT